MFAAVMPGLSQPPMWIAWLSLALVVGAYLITKLPRRITVAASVAVIAAGVANPTTQVIFNGIECCDLWWILYFICIPPQWGFC
jgi:hypothetical protein